MPSSFLFLDGNVVGKHTIQVHSECFLEHDTFTWLLFYSWVLQLCLHHKTPPWPHFWWKIKDLMESKLHWIMLKVTPLKAKHWSTLSKSRHKTLFKVLSRLCRCKSFYNYYWGMVALALCCVPLLQWWNREERWTQPCSQSCTESCRLRSVPSLSLSSSISLSLYLSLFLSYTHLSSTLETLHCT